MKSLYYFILICHIEKKLKKKTFASFHHKYKPEEEKNEKVFPKNYCDNRHNTRIHK